MIRREMGLFKLALVLIQIVIILMLAPMTKEFVAPFMGGVVLNTVTYVILFCLHAYAYQVCLKSRMPNAGHVVSVAAVMFQSCWVLYLVATILLGFEMLLLLTKHWPFKHKVKKVNSPKGMSR